MIWSYWEGPRLPHIDLCIRSMQFALGSDFCLVTPDSLYDHISSNTLHKNFQSLPQPALKADCVRAALLATHGGWWFDADTVAFRHPDEQCAEAVYLVWDRPPSRVLNGYIYLCPGNDSANKWLDAVNRSLSLGADNPSWCSLGEGILTSLLLYDPRSYQAPRSVFLPIDIDSHVEKFFQPGNPLDYINQNTVCFGLNHSWFMYYRSQDMKEASWRDSPLLIHRLFTLCKERVG